MQALTAFAVCACAVGAITIPLVVLGVPVPGHIAINAPESSPEAVVELGPNPTGPRDRPDPPDVVATAPPATERTQPSSPAPSGPAAPRPLPIAPEPELPGAPPAAPATPFPAPPVVDDAPAPAPAPPPEAGPAPEPSAPQPPDQPLPTPAPGPQGGTGPGPAVQPPPPPPPPPPPLEPPEESASPHPWLPSPDAPQTVRRRLPPVLPITPNPVYVQAVEEALALLAQVVVSAPPVTLPVPDPSGRGTGEPVEPPSAPHVDPEPGDADVSDSSACARIEPCHGFDPPPSGSH